MLTRTSPESLKLVAIAIGAGLVAAFHMGKVPAALPDITQSLQLSLPQAGLVVSIFSILAAVFGIFVGILSSKVGRVTAGITGLIAVTTGALFGGFSESYPQLLLSRVIEGLGFVLIAITMPGLINALCPPRHKALAMGIWGAFIPAAMCLMLLTTPTVIDQQSWREVWLLTAILSVGWLLVFGFAFRSTKFEEQINQSVFSSLAQLCTRTPVVIVCIFICYSALFAAVTAFLPTYWTGELQLDIKNAAYLSALVVSGNIVGNILAGAATGRGIKMPYLFMLAFIIGGGAATLLFQVQHSVTATLLAAIVFSLFSGLIPGAIFANLPGFVPTVAAMPLMVGLIFQGAGIGQVGGPLLLATVVERGSSWNTAGLATAVLAIVGLALSCLLPRTNDASTSP